jgi:hypothetical protein
VLLQLERGAGALSVKLINGKVTFVGRRLWPALLAVVQSPKQSTERAPTAEQAQRSSAFSLGV